MIKMIIMIKIIIMIIMIIIIKLNNHINCNKNIVGWSIQLLGRNFRCLKIVNDYVFLDI